MIIQSLISIAVKSENILLMALKIGEQYPVKASHKKSLLEQGFTVGKVINSGKYGHVCEATASKEKREIAVKILELDKQSDHYVKHFLPKELKAMESLKHEFIVQVIKILLKDKSVYVFMERALGGDLLDLLDQLKAPVPEARAKQLFRGVVRALEYMHAQGYAHRDVKSENILLMDKERTKAKITDFGFSTTCLVAKTGQRKLSDTMCGTPFYSPPEMHRKEQKYDAMKSDMFSLGVVVYIVVHNEMPFTDKDVLQVAKDPNKHTLDVKYSVQSPDLIDLLKKLIQVEPNKRLTASQTLAHKWFNESQK